MNRILLIVTVLIFAALACSMAENTPQPTATPELRAAAVGYLEQKMFDDMTQTANERAAVATAARLTATQQVLDATATEQRHAENVQATQAANAATQAVWNVTVAAAQAQDTATAQAQAKATEQANIQATSTAEAYLTATQQALLGVTATIEHQETATADWKTQQAPFVAAQMTAVKAQAESAELAASRERMTNGVMAWGPWAIVLVAAAAFVFVTVRKSQVGTIERDANGMMPGVVIFHNGKKEFISPDRMPGPVITIEAQGVTAPQLAAPEQQAETTRRAQAVEAINALPPQTQRQGMDLMAQTFNEVKPRPQIEWTEPVQVKNWIDEAEGRLNEEVL
jgi:hypothetical protein